MVVIAIIRAFALLALAGENDHSLIEDGVAEAGGGTVEHSLRLHPPSRV